VTTENTLTSGFHRGKTRENDSKNLKSVGNIYRKRNEKSYSFCTLAFFFFFSILVNGIAKKKRKKKKDSLLDRDLTFKWKSDRETDRTKR